MPVDSKPFAQSTDLETAIADINADEPQKPSTVWVIISDWFNLAAGFVLMAAFLEGALINHVKAPSLLTPEGAPTTQALQWLQFLFCTEGVLYALAEFLMVGIMAMTPKAFGGGSTGTMQFAVLMAGGVFFAFSGLVFPGCISNLTYVFSSEPCNHVAAGATPYAWNAMAHFGISCFMAGTLTGFKGILSLPKTSFISPFWGCTMYFLGAWTIGIFKFWGPVLLGGFNPHQNEPTFDMTAPSVAESFAWTWWMGVLGAFFLTVGAGIFCVMNKSLTCSRS